jgi:hypothetical protein
VPAPPRHSFQLEQRHEGFLGISTLPMVFMRLAGPLLLEQLLLARDVAAVTLGQHVLALGLDGVARDDLTAHRGLERHRELLARDQFFQLAGQRMALVLRGVAVHDHRQCVDRRFVDQNVHAQQRPGAILVEDVVERGVTARATLELVEIVDDHLGQRQFVGQQHALRVEILHAHVLAAAVGGLHTGPMYRPA